MIGDWKPVLFLTFNLCLELKNKDNHWTNWVSSEEDWANGLSKIGLPQEKNYNISWGSE